MEVIRQLDPADTPEAPGGGEGRGDDDGLILWMLSLTPTERLAVAQDFVDTFGPRGDSRDP